MATSTIPKSLANQMNAVEDDLSTKPTRTSTGWGTELSWTFNNALSILAINRAILALVWTAGSGQDISVLVISANGNYNKIGSNGVLEFGVNSTDTTYTLTRSGSTVTFTAPNNTSIKVLT